MLKCQWIGPFCFILLLAHLGCEASRRVGVNVTLRAGSGEEIQCGDTFALQGVEGVKLGHAKLFVHGVQVWSPSQEKWLGVEVQDKGSPWHTQGVVLVDLDTERCKGAEAARSPGFLVVAPVKDWSKLKFQVGVPFALNHADPTRAASPLDFMPMHWGWQAGYKFLRLELDLPSGGRWQWHLGSTQCKGEVGAITGCEQPNRLEVVMPRVGQAQRLGVALDLEALLKGIRLQEAQGCMSTAGENECDVLIANFDEAMKAY